MKKQNEKYYQFSPAARKFNQANGHSASQKEVQDEIDSTKKKDKIHSCMTKKESEEYWNKFTKNEKAVIDFIDRVIVNKEFEE
jgi:hypothetical protein|tara:strand:- start:1357 stop:1605 length:249 start_codon:yes stop_codon:yes gene_type:complete